MSYFNTVLTNLSKQSTNFGPILKINYPFLRKAFFQTRVDNHTFYVIRKPFERVMTNWFCGRLKPTRRFFGLLYGKITKNDLISFMIL